MKYALLFVGLIFFSCDKTPIDIPIGSENNVETTVIFSANMSQVGNNDFNPDVDLLFVVGDFNDWCQTSCDQLIRINDDQYEIMFTNLTNSFFQVDTEFQYKFRINEENWETPNPLVSNCTPNEFGGYNRLHVIVAGQNSLQWYFNNENGN